VAPGKIDFQRAISSLSLVKNILRNFKWRTWWSIIRNFRGKSAGGKFDGETYHSRSLLSFSGTDSFCTFYLDDPNINVVFLVLFTLFVLFVP
jgi:hypothetical protein